MTYRGQTSPNVGTSGGTPFSSTIGGNVNNGANAVFTTDSNGNPAALVSPNGGTVPIGPALAPYLGAVGGINKFPNNLLAAASATQMMMRRRWTTTKQVITQLQVQVSNVYVTGGVETGPGAAATISCGIEVNGVNLGVFKWSGSATVSVASGAVSPLSDVLYVYIPKGVNPFFRTYYTSAAGIVYFKEASVTLSIPSPVDTTNGESNATALSGLADQTAGTGAITGGSASANLSFGPNLVVSNCNLPSWHIIGDSRTVGSGDAALGLSGDVGTAGRSIGAYFPYTTHGIGGDTTAAFIASNAIRKVNQIYHSHIFCGYGINDLFGGTQTAASLITNLQTISALFGGRPFYVCTLPTRVQSTSNNCATLAGQTIATNDAERVKYNNLIRAGGIAGITDYFEFADPVESSRNSGKWAVNGSPYYLTGDGTHELNTANILIANSPAVTAKMAAISRL